MAGIGDRIRSSQIWRSVVRHGFPRDRQGQARAVISSLFLHIHPVDMRRYSLRFWFTWGMGWLTFVLFVIEAISGIALMFYYRPAAEHAYADMQALRATVSFGLVREIHRWGAHAMVIAAWLHMLRVFLTGSYKPPREFNWCIGVALLVLTMLLSFTGYLLPWDQLALWAVTVGTNMVSAAPLIGSDGPWAGWLPAGWDPKSLLLGGPDVGPPALLRFYVLHCAVLPVISAILISLHFWRIRKDGGISGPQEPFSPSPARRRPNRVPLLLASAALMVVLLAAIFGSWSGVKGLVNWYCRPERLLPIAIAVLAVGLAAYRCWSRPAWAAFAGLLFLGAWTAASLDPQFSWIILRPDNVAITLMVFATTGFLWLAARRMAINDERLGRGLPPCEAGDQQRVMVWPDVLRVELVIFVIAAAVLIVWSILLRAPLEAAANPADVPNPSKAPWYFVGLQELLVYFDPWLAGFLIPMLTIIGLCALPYLDVNSQGNGYYTLRERPLAITVFLFGFLILWLLPIVIGTFLRGPNWSFFGPFEPWDAQQAAVGTSINLSELLWSRALGHTLPVPESAGAGSSLLRELPGLIALSAYFVGVPLLLRRTWMRTLAAQMGRARYLALMFFLTAMGLLPIKMLLRWLFHVKYIVSFPASAFNI
jgi:quinol-cytochrome oxidoreductase complex cytochrome b subunit